MKERAFVIGVNPSQSSDEIARLARALNFTITGSLVQRAEKPHPDSYLGPGLVKRLALESRDADVIISDGVLTPRQLRILEAGVNKPILDRNVVILSLFADRARSHAGRMQVELAQAEYDLARLRGRWSHLERQGGGRNRGAGEKQSEEDRRQLRRRISILKKKISELETQRASQRHLREQSDTLRVALVGYTNAGKSSLLASLTGAETTASPRPFETLDPLTRRLDTARGPILISDTVGFIAKLPAELVAAFQATLDEVRGADLILHVADGSDPQWITNRQVVEETLIRLGVEHTPRLDVVTHIDCSIAWPLIKGAHYLSPVTDQGINVLKQTLIDYRDARLTPLEMSLESDQGYLLSEIARYDRELIIFEEGSQLHVKALLPRATRNRLLGTVPSPNNTFSH